MASVDIELSQRDTTIKRNEIKLAEATQKAEVCSSQLSEYNSLLEELKNEGEILTKEKEEFKTLKRETVVVLAQDEKRNFENNKFKAQQIRLDEENHRLLT